MASSASSQRRILCVGLVCLDLVTVTSEFPIEDSDNRFILHHRWQRGGNAANNCTILSHLGAPCELMCTIGTDPSQVNADFLLKDLETHGIKLDSAVFYEKHSAPMTVIIVNETNGSRTILHHRGTIPELNLHDFESLDLSLYKWIHFEGRNYENMVEMLALVEKWNCEHDSDSRITISVEVEKFRPRFESIITPADYVFISKDIAHVCGLRNKEETAVTFAKYLKNGAIVICPWGEDGVAYLTKDGNEKVLTVAAHCPAKVVDTLGAGDTFIGSVIYALFKNYSVTKALELGCAIAGAKCGVHGLNIKELALKLWKDILQKEFDYKNAIKQ